jgi:hypothetical protein
MRDEPEPVVVGIRERETVTLKLEPGEEPEAWCEVTGVPVDKIEVYRDTLPPMSSGDTFCLGPYCWTMP